MQVVAQQVLEDGACPSAIVFSRSDLARAIQFWDRSGDGAEPGMCLSRQASELVEVLAKLDFARETQVLLAADSALAHLLSQGIERLNGLNGGPAAS